MFHRGTIAFPSAAANMRTKDLPEGHSIMNESGMTTDSAGRLVIANSRADPMPENPAAAGVWIEPRKQPGGL